MAGCLQLATLGGRGWRGGCCGELVAHCGVGALPLGTPAGADIPSGAHAGILQMGWEVQVAGGQIGRSQTLTRFWSLFFRIKLWGARTWVLRKKHGKRSMEGQVT